MQLPNRRRLVSSILMFKFIWKYGGFLEQMNNMVHQEDNISRILWYSDSLHNPTSAGNSIFATNHNTTSCRKSIMQPIRLPKNIRNDIFWRHRLRSDEPYWRYMLAIYYWRYIDAIYYWRYILAGIWQNIPAPTALQSVSHASVTAPITHVTACSPVRGCDIHAIITSS